MTWHVNHTRVGKSRIRTRDGVSPNRRLALLCERAVAYLVCLITFFSAGCQTMNWTPGTALLKDEPEFVTPTKIIPVWSDTVLHQAGRSGRRGCGGRVMFYSGDGKKAVQVDGSLVVYVWDDSSDEKQRKPNRKYVFRADEFQNHYSASTIGDSYSFWIPWDGTGGDQTELTLIARFIGRNGAEVTSTPGKVILPGEAPALAKKETTHRSSHSETWHHEVDAENDGIRQVNFEETTSKSSKKRERKSLTTAEIPLTDGFLQRNMQHPQAYSSDELFEDEPSLWSAKNAISEAGADSSRKTTPSEQRLTSANLQSLIAAEGLRSEESTGPANADAMTRPADRSLRFRHRVRTSREAQRSVGHALSERYRTESRPAPWERD